VKLKHDILSKNVAEKIISMKSPTVLVVGDFMLDTYATGSIDRLCPDYPVPVVKNITEVHEPGGAGHLAMSLRDLGANVICAGIIGNDSSGHMLKDILEKAGCSTAALKTNKSYKTIHKRSLFGRFAGKQPVKIVREDVEKDIEQTNGISYIPAGIVSQCHLVCIQDHNKGTIGNTTICDLLKLGLPVIADPSPKRVASFYAGCDILTPNRNEAFSLTGEKDIKTAAQAMINAGIKNVIVTLDSDGSAWFDRTSSTYDSLDEIQVCDVTGAGDVFVAATAIGYYNSFSAKEILRFANAVGSIKVSKPGSATVSTLEVYQSLYGKIIDSSVLGSYLTEIKNNNKVVFSNGCFDAGLTYAHIECLRFAKEQGNILIVALNDDESISRLKGPSRPVLPLRDRMSIIAGLEFVDYVISFSEDTPLETIKLIKPDIIVKGGDYKPEHVVGFDLAKVVIFPYVDCISTTDKLRNSGK